MSYTSQDTKNKIVGISAISAIALILVVIILISSILNSSGAVTKSGDLMKKYKVSRQTTKLTESFKNDYFKLTSKILNQQIADGGNAAISLIDTANTLSFLACASNGKTRNQIESLLGGDAISFAGAISTLDNSTKYTDNNKSGMMSSSSVWFNNSQLFGVKKAFLKTNAKHFGLNLQRAGFGEIETSNLARETVASATNQNSFSNIKFNESENINIVSGASFRSLWADQASTKDTYENLFFGQKCDYTCAYFKTVESEYISGNVFSGIAKDFADGFTFIALVPNMNIDGYIYPLKDMLDEINEKNMLKELYSSTSKTKVAVTLPFYSNSVKNPTSIDFSKTLKNLGVTSIFGNSADISAMVEDTENLKLDNYYISGDISITPAGTLNVSADNSVSKKQLDECKVSVEFNRSFIYFIYDNESELPIYLGIVNHIE